MKVSQSNTCSEVEGFESASAITVTELNITEEPVVAEPQVKTLQLVGRGVHFYKGAYQCSVSISLTDTAGQAYLYNDGSSCKCRNSRYADIKLDDGNEYGAYAREISCYIEQ